MKSIFKILSLGLICVSYHSFAQQASTSNELWQGRQAAVVLTYDDALNVHLDNVVPALEAHGLKGTFYLSAFSDGSKNRIEDCFLAGIIEPLKVKTQAVSSATEVATMILRIHDVLVSEGRSKGAPGMQGLPPGYAGMD